MRKPLVMGNWKLNGTKESVTSLVNALKEPAAQSPSVEVAVCAPAIFIGLVESLAKDTAIKYGSEDVDVHTKGAFTGENSPEMIKEFGCKYAIVGHSERRAYHNETNEVVAAKYKAAQESGLINAVIAYEPIWAIGTGKTATPEIAQDVHATIRSFLASFDAAVADKVQILYGGSCNAKTAPDLFKQPDIDGGLVGGASLKPLDFAAIIKAAEV